VTSALNQAEIATPVTASFLLSGDGLIPAPSVPLEDRGFRYGMHLFETVGVRNGMWMFWQEHLALLHSSAAQAGFSCSKIVRQQLPQLPSLHPFAEGIVRLYWTAGPGEPLDPPNEGSIFLLVQPGPLPPCNRKFRVGICPMVFPGHFHGWKTGNYWPNLQALQSACSEGFDETLLFSPNGHLIGAACANVFLQLGGQWLTPLLENGTRPGVIRQWLLNQGQAREQTISRIDLEKVEAMALTNSRIGVVPVRKLQGRGLSCGNGFRPPLETGFL